MKCKERDNVEKSKEKYYAKQADEEQKNREFTEELLRRVKNLY